MHPPAPAPAEAATLRRSYPGRPDQIHAVRADLRPLLSNCAIAADAILCASELAANAALHSNSRLPGGHFTVRATFCKRGHARIAVEDQGGHWIQAVRAPSLGRGLDIVHTLAADWGISGDYRARTFWVHLGETPNTPRCRTGAGPCQAVGPEEWPVTVGPSPAAIFARVRRAAQPGQWTAVLDSQRLRQLRHLHGLSQETVAYRAGLSLATIGRLEREPRPHCRTRTMTLLAAAIGEHPAAIIRDLIPATPRPSMRADMSRKSSPTPGL
jgi:DNA-binding XRE family transcriptional regulator